MAAATDTEFAAWAASARAGVDGFLEDWWSPAGPWSRELDRQVASHLEGLRSAITYSACAPGKRIRPLVLLAAAGDEGGTAGAAVQAAAALECIHAYSLVHDDLPAMDDDDLRRGRPTSHRVHGEATAILVGDALQAEAFAMLATLDAPAHAIADLVRVLARAAGAGGMVGGQQLDVEGSPHVADVHRLKTGALLGAAARMGSVLAGHDPATQELHGHCGSELGTLFQLVDDLLDAVASSDRTGKSAGTDERRGRRTAVSTHGVAEVRSAVERQHARCRRLAQDLHPGGPRLAVICDVVRDRAG